MKNLSDVQATSPARVLVILPVRMRSSKITKHIQAYTIFTIESFSLVVFNKWHPRFKRKLGGKSQRRCCTGIVVWKVDDKVKFEPFLCNFPGWYMKFKACIPGKVETCENCGEFCGETLSLPYSYIIFPWLDTTSSDTLSFRQIDKVSLDSFEAQ